VMAARKFKESVKEKDSQPQELQRED